MRNHVGPLKSKTSQNNVFIFLKGYCTVKIFTRVKAIIPEDFSSLPVQNFYRDLADDLAEISP